MKLRLLAGTINDYTAEDGWKNYTLDAVSRPVWDHDLEGFVRVDFVANIALGVEHNDLRDEMFDAIRFHHVLEHIPDEEAHAALTTLWRILKHGGELDLEVPNAEAYIAAYVNGELDRAGLSQWMLGEQLPTHTIHDCHRSVWTPHEVYSALAASGFRTPHDRDDVGYALRVKAMKP